MSSLTDRQLAHLYEFFKIDPADIPYKVLRDGIKVEMEHGSIHRLTNVTDDDLVPTMKIVLAHLREGIEYYDSLNEMEEKLKKTGHVPKYFKDGR